MLLTYRLKLLQPLVVLNSNCFICALRPATGLEFGGTGDYGYRWWQVQELIATQGD